MRSTFVGQFQAVGRKVRTSSNQVRKAHGFLSGSGASVNIPLAWAGDHGLSMAMFPTMNLGWEQVFSAEVLSGVVGWDGSVVLGG